MNYIGMFDILGFKQAIQDIPLEELKDILGDELNIELTACVHFNTGSHRDKSYGDNLKKHAEVSIKECSYIRFSDTILIYGDDDMNGLLHVLLASSRLFAFMLLKGLPIRGAVTRGELHVDSDNTLVIGEGLLRAYELENIQNWSGAIIDDQRIDIPDRVLDEYWVSYDYSKESVFWSHVMKGKLICPYNAPLKKGKTLREFKWCLGWPDTLKKMPENHLRECLYNYYPFSKNLTPKTLEDSANEKIENTVSFFNYYQRWAKNFKFHENFATFQRVTCHVCDNGGIKFTEGCSGCGRVSENGIELKELAL